MRSRGAFAGTCIGVILLVISLELVRRAHREYDAWIFRQWRLANNISSSTGLRGGSGGNSESDSPGPKGRFEDPNVRALGDTGARGMRFRPTLVQQAVRSGLYMVQFGVGYFVMLLAMYASPFHYFPFIKLRYILTMRVTSRYYNGNSLPFPSHLIPRIYLLFPI